MTLIVAVKCSNGIVVGADSAATFGALGQTTIQQSFDKIEIVGGTALFAASGPVGLSQRLKGELGAALAQGLVGPSWQVMTALRQRFWAHIGMELQIAAAASSAIGNIAVNSAVGSSVVAVPIGDEAHLFQFDQQGAPEEATPRTPFVCIGSGQSLADPFIAFVKSILWQDGVLPSLPQGVFASLWTLEQCIDVAPGGLAKPSHLFVLERSQAAWVAREMSAQELQEHYEAIAQAKSSIQSLQSTAPPENTPEPPSP